MSADVIQRRLAFIGDAVLYLVTTRALFEAGGNPDSAAQDRTVQDRTVQDRAARYCRSSVHGLRRSLTAAEMHRARLPVIGNKHLAARGRAFGLGDVVISASCRGPVVPDRRVADSVEALVGASFTVGGLEAADSFIRRRILPAEFAKWRREGPR
jgi:dsRNA-specific ribonuclease